MQRYLVNLMAGVAMTAFLPAVLAAQEAGFWIQIEAQPTPSRAQDRASDYARTLPNVASFDIGSGWFGVTLGPFDRDTARSTLSELRRDRVIPADSFVVETRVLRDQIWPPEGFAQTPDANAANQEPTILPPLAGVPTVTITDGDETLEQSQRAERALTLDEKKELQSAMQWAGVYTSTIDGLFGRGTRNAMAAWQEAKNFRATGVLSTNQRRLLLGEYYAVLEGMDMQLVRDAAAGIEIEMPTGVVARSDTTPPFVSYTNTGDIEASVFLISQPGNRQRLAGLYEIMQTLEIVPADGPRETNGRNFTIQGVNEDIHSYTYATISGEAIKGFTLVWPAGDDERRTRILGLMQNSFTALDGVLDPASVDPGDEQSLDMVSGLAIRQPIRTRSGFYIDGTGRVLTTAEAVGECAEILLDNTHPASIAHLDADLGIAVLEPDDALSTLSVAAFQSGTPRLQSDVIVAGYPFGGVLSAPSLSFGALADIRGLDGDTSIYRLEMDTRHSDAGGPVFNTAGQVIGLLLTNDNSTRQLPASARFAADAPAIMASLDAAGIGYETAGLAAPITPERLTRAAAPMTALVTCWE